MRKTEKAEMHFSNAAAKLRAQGRNSSEAAALTEIASGLKVLAAAIRDVYELVERSHRSSAAPRSKPRSAPGRTSLQNR